MRIYLDHNATTPVAPSVVAAVTSALREQFGNASSIHSFGQTAKTVVDDARAAVADLIGAGPQEIVFTSGGTESDNLAIRGVAEALQPAKRRHLIATSIEHEAVLHTVKALLKRGWTTSLLPVDNSGVVDPQALEAVITDDTALVSVMHANNEIGTIQPLTALATIAHRHGALFHTDAVQSMGKLRVDVTDLDVDLLSLSAHKFYGPKGVGALWVRRGSRLVSTMTGGKQERNRRAGTENVPGIVGLGVASRLAIEKADSEAERVAALRDHLEAGILRCVPGTLVNGDPTRRIANTTNISFDRVEAESLLIALDLDGIAVSTGSACSSGTLEPSHVLRAMGFSPHRAQNSIRFSLGAGNTLEEIDRVLDALPRVVDKLRNVSRASSSLNRPAVIAGG
jgi:cysteine desulfurase